MTKATEKSFFNVLYIAFYLLNLNVWSDVYLYNKGLNDPSCLTKVGSLASVHKVYIPLYVL